MAASYPSSIVGLDTKNDGDTIFANHVDALQDEIIALETALLNGFQHNLIALNDNTRDLGDSTHAWRNLWTKGTTQFNGVAYTWPGADGASGQQLQTNGSKVLSWGAPGNTNNIVNGRLTLTTGVPVTTADVLAATTLYFTPYDGKYIALYDGSVNWNLVPFAELSIAIPATTNTMYDVFVFNNAGTATLELLAWTNDTTRATALVLQDGVLVKTGATTRRYVGSMRTTAVSGQTEDSASNRFLYNYYNKKQRRLQRFESTTSWTYASTTIRQARADTNNQVSFILGVSEEAVEGWLNATASSQDSVDGVAGFGLDSTTTFVANQLIAQPHLTTNGTGNIIGRASLSSVYRGLPGIGKHTLSWNEMSTSGTATFYAAGGGLTQGQLTSGMLVTFVG